MPLSELKQTGSQRVMQVIAEQAGKPVEEVTPDKEMCDLGLDSLDLIELTLYLEEEFNVGTLLLDEQAIETARTVQQTIDIVEAHCKVTGCAF